MSSGARAVANEQVESSDQGMKRRLGLPAVFSIAAGAMFSSGFFLLPGLAADETGPVLPLAYLAASVLMLPAIFSIGELSSAMPRAGGPYLFITRSFGPQVGVLGAFGEYMVMVFKGAFAFVGVGIYLALVVDVPIMPVALGLIAAFTLLNLAGVKHTATAEMALVAILLLLLGYFLLAGITDVVREDIPLRDRFQPLLPFGWQGLVSGIALVYISYGGIGQVAALAEEVKNPARAIPYGMLIALGVTTLFYVVGTALMVALVAPEALRDDTTPVATAAAQLVTFPLPAWVIVVAAVAAFTSTGNAAILAAARYPLAMARDQLLGSRFGMVSERGVPRFSVIVTGITLALVVLMLDVEGIAKVGSAFLLFVFLLLCLAVVIFRESGLDEYQPGYQSPFYPGMQIAGVVVYALLIFQSGLEAIAFILAIVVLGLAWYRFGVWEKTRFSAAIRQAFVRLARQSAPRDDIGIPALSRPRLADLVDRAVLIQLEDMDFEQALGQAADALTSRLGGDRDLIMDRLHREAKRWKCQIESALVVSPVMLDGIEQPEMIILRGDIHLDSEHYHGLIVLADDERSPSRLIRLLSRLEETVSHSDFLTAWKEAKNFQGLKEALQQGVRTLTLRVEASGPTASLHGTALRDADLPAGSIVMLIQREGEEIVPNGNATLQAGDEITIVAEELAKKELTKRFAGHIPG